MVRQPHVCATSDVWHAHSQCTLKYLDCRIVSMVWVDCDIMVAALIEVIHSLINNLPGSIWESLEDKGAHFLTFVGRLEKSLCKSVEDLKCHSAL
jgi:hypothetical protein